MSYQSPYAIGTEVTLSFPEAIEKTTELLKEQGFGILTTIDVQAKMKEKLDKDMDEYTILGACNPKLAAQALDKEQEIGLLLPCNVIVYRSNGRTKVSAQLPSAMLSITNNNDLDEIAQEAQAKLEKVIQQLAQ